MSLAALIKKGSLRGLATATPATPATEENRQPLTVATVATVAVANAPGRAANDPAHATATQQERTIDAPSQAPYWPHTQHANDTELDRMEARLMIFKRRGMDDAQADKLADKIFQAERDQTEQVTCHLCQHFNPRRKTCSNFKSAGGSQEVGELSAMMQRCTGFKGSKV